MPASRVVVNRRYMPFDFWCVRHNGERCLMSHQLSTVTSWTCNLCGIATCNWGAHWNPRWFHHRATVGNNSFSIALILCKLQLTTAPRACKSALVQFMSFHQNTPCTADHEFFWEELAELTAQDLAYWMNQHAFGNTIPTGGDHPIHARSSSTHHWKKSSCVSCQTRASSGMR